MDKAEFYALATRMNVAVASRVAWQLKMNLFHEFRDNIGAGTEITHVMFTLSTEDQENG